MADEKNTVEKLEERLANAAAKFKEMKDQMDAKDKEIEVLKNQVSDLEDELNINGGAKEEVDGLKARLEKAKEIFSTQKAKIAELSELNNNHVSQITKLESEIETYKDSATELKCRIEDLEKNYTDLYTRLENIKEIVNA